MPKLFVPYVYVPSAEAPHAMVVTPWGSLRVNKQFVLQLAVSVAVLLVSVWAWRCAASSRSKRAARGDREEGEGEEDEEEEEEEEDLLDESLIQKGQHSYYYSHQRQGDKDADGSRQTVVSTFGWTDNKETINIYLTDKAVVGMKDEQLELEWTKKSLSLHLLMAPGGSQARSLEISALFGEISDVTWKATKDQLQVTLTKATPGIWRSLNGAAKHMEEHIEYDESLYD